MCRALGIPCRCVTNYISAHDTNSSLSVDKFYNEDGEEAAEEAATPSNNVRSDSVWNFHVWNEVWMTRRDLKGPFGGWQVMDNFTCGEEGYFQVAKSVNRKFC